MSDRDVMERWVKEMEAHDFDAAADLMTDDFTFSGPVAEPVGKQDVVELHRALITAMPDWTFNARIGDDDGRGHVRFEVEIEATFTERLTLPPLGIDGLAPTGRHGRNAHETGVATVRNGKLASIAVDPDPDAGVPGILRRVGAVN